MPAIPDAQELGHVDLFRGCSPSELVRINDLLGRTKFPSGATILYANQPGEVVYVVIDGTLKVSTLQSNGKELTLALLGPNANYTVDQIKKLSAGSIDIKFFEPGALVPAGQAFDSVASGEWRASLTKLRQAS